MLHWKKLRASINISLHTDLLQFSKKVYWMTETLIHSFPVICHFYPLRGRSYILTLIYNKSLNSHNIPVRQGSLYSSYKKETLIQKYFYSLTPDCVLEDYNFNTTYTHSGTHSGWRGLHFLIMIITGSLYILSLIPKYQYTSRGTGTIYYQSCSVFIQDIHSFDKEDQLLLA